MDDTQKTNNELREELVKLRKRITELETMIQNANSVILRMDTKGNITFFNEFAQRFFGYYENEILGHNVIGTIVPKTDEAGSDLAEMIEDIGKNPERYSVNENENMRRSGERVWILWTNKAMLDKNGSITEILCIGNDITKFKRYS